MSIPSEYLYVKENLLKNILISLTIHDLRVIIGLNKVDKNMITLENVLQLIELKAEEGCFEQFEINDFLEYE